MGSSSIQASEFISAIEDRYKQMPYHNRIHVLSFSFGHAERRKKMGRVEGYVLDCVLLFCFFALLGSVVFSRGSKHVLFWRTVQEQ